MLALQPDFNSPLATFLLPLQARLEIGQLWVDALPLSAPARSSLPTLKAF